MGAAFCANHPTGFGGIVSCGGDAASVAANGKQSRAAIQCEYCAGSLQCAVVVQFYIADVVMQVHRSGCLDDSCLHRFIEADGHRFIAAEVGEGAGFTIKHASSICSAFENNGYVVSEFEGGTAAQVDGSG